MPYTTESLGAKVNGLDVSVSESAMTERGGGAEECACCLKGGAAWRVKTSRDPQASERHSPLRNDFEIKIQKFGDSK